MLHVFAVVAVFVVANTGGFLVYRTFRSTEAAPAPTEAATFARPNVPSQAQPQASTTLTSSPTRVADPEPVPSPDLAGSTVREPTPLPKVDDAKPKRIAPQRTVKRVPVRPKPAEQPVEKNNKLLEMDANPYKRGE